MNEVWYCAIIARDEFVGSHVRSFYHPFRVAGSLPALLEKLRTSNRALDPTIEIMRTLPGVRMPTVGRHDPADFEHVPRLEIEAVEVAEHLKRFGSTVPDPEW